MDEKMKTIIALILFIPQLCMAGALDETLLNNISIQNHKSNVNYRSIDRAAISDFLQSTPNKRAFQEWSKEKKLSFLINLYNISTINLILINNETESIKNIGMFWQSPWSIKSVTLFNNKLTLDELETTIRDYNDYRIHFAINCASKSCPPLSNKLYTEKNLDTELEAAMINFLRDRTVNYFHNNKLTISPIFKWYSEDFGDLNTFVQNNKKTMGISGTVEDISYGNYDWSLNSIQNR